MVEGTDAEAGMPIAPATSSRGTVVGTGRTSHSEPAYALADMLFLKEDIPAVFNRASLTGATLPH